MGRIKYQLKKRLYRLKAYRRKGFGVHSPFTYHLIANVIEAKLHYYAFTQLSPYRKIVVKALKSKLKEDHFDKSLAKRYKEEVQHIESSDSIDRLIFRLMIFWNAKLPAYFGSGVGFEMSYMAKADSRVNVSWFVRGELFSEYSDDLFRNYLGIQNYKSLNYDDIEKANQVFDFLVFSKNTSSKVLLYFLENYECILCKRCMIIIQNLHENESIKLFWNQLKKLERISVSLDLFHMGILISRDGMQKQDYVRKYRF